MTYEEAKTRINKIKDSTADFQSSVNKVQSELVNKTSDLRKINTRIAADIGQSDIVSYSGRDVSSITSSINEALSMSASALSTLSKDATDEIKNIVDSYNSSIQYDEEGHAKSPRLNYETISLSSIAGVSAPSSDGGKAASTGGGGGYYGNSGAQSGNDTPTSFNGYLSKLGSEDIYSKDIENWDSYVNEFLSSNDLSDSVESITIEGKVIKCKLKNGKVITIENVSNTSDLANEIKKNL